MDISHIGTLPQIASFLQAHSENFLSPSMSKKEIYEWMRKLLIELKHQKIGKKERGHLVFMFSDQFLQSNYKPYTPAFYQYVRPLYQQSCNSTPPTSDTIFLTIPSTIE